MVFELKARDCLGRIGILHTAHGTVETPALLPVINPRHQLIAPKAMERFGAEAIITNSYIIWRDEQLRERALADGLHAMLGFERTIMTDSGSFQFAQYGLDAEPAPEIIVEFQRDIGADIGTILDIISSHDATRDEASLQLEETLRRARAATALKGDMALALTVQGALYPDLREHSAREMTELRADIAPIGSMVPLMENYRFREVAELVIASKMGLSPSIPVHLFGCGHPMLFPLAVLLGVDLFDSAAYAKYAKMDRLLFPDGTRTLSSLRYLPCTCPVCSATTIEELEALEAVDRTQKLAEHNLWVSFAELRNIKNAIADGTLFELVEMRCRAHPALLSALEVIRRHQEYLERFDQLTKTRFFYTGDISLARPAVYRFQKRLFERYENPKSEVLVVLPDTNRPYHRAYHNVMRRVSNLANAHFVVNSVFGPVPIELDEIYPIGQSVIPEPMASEREPTLLKRYAHAFDYPLALFWDDDALDTLRFLCTRSQRNALDMDILRVRAVADMQFGRGIGGRLIDGDIDLVKSKRTGKIRNVLVNRQHILSVRNDGYFTLKWAGAVMLHQLCKPPRLRVTVNDDAVPFVKSRCSVFAKFVSRCDPELRPRDEVLIVDKADALLAIGRALMNREEMAAFHRGMAVKVYKSHKVKVLHRT